MLAGLSFDRKSLPRHSAHADLIPKGAAHAGLAEEKAAA